VTGLQATGWKIKGSISRGGKRFCSSPKHPASFSTQLASCAMGTWGSSLEVKQPGCQDDYSPLASAEVKNEWSCTHTPALCPHSMDRKNITFFAFT